MGIPRTYRTEGIIVRRMNLGEADKLLTILTPNHGKLRLLAKAIRRTKAKLSGHLDLFCRSELMVARGNNLDVVSGAMMLDGYRNVREDLWLTSCALYALEFVDRFSEENLENADLYDLLVETLEALNTGRNPEIVLRYFELHALAVTGYRPQLQRCLVCDKPIEPEANRLGPSGVTCPDCQSEQGSHPVSIDALKVLRFLQRADLPTAIRLRPDTRVSREIDSHLRRMVRSILERELKSSEFLELVRRQTPA